MGPVVRYITTAPPLASRSVASLSSVSRQTECQPLENTIFLGLHSRVVASLEDSVVDWSDVLIDKTTVLQSFLCFLILFFNDVLAVT